MKGRGKGKDGKEGKGVPNSMTFEEQREAVRKFVDERLASGIEWRGRHKEMQEELQRVLWVNAKRFKNLFQQTVAQYIHSAYKEKASLGKATLQAAMPRGPLTQDEEEMRAQRLRRFESHLSVDRTPVAMVSFTEGEGSHFDGGPIVGELTEMCSRSEAKEREMTRQLDKFEWKVGTDPKHPEVNLALATRKYQRSSADKAYRSQDVRTLAACWRTTHFLMTQVLDFDDKPKPEFAVQNVPYIEVYSYLRDRTRAVRVDLHLQQPRSTAQRVFAEVHECCLRFEMLSLFLLSGGRGGSTTEKYDPKLGLKAISQTIEPLLNAYQAIRDKQLAKSILAEMMGGIALDDDADGGEEYNPENEMAVHRYIILLLMSFSQEQLRAHLAKLDRETLSHPLVSFATQAYAAFQTDDYGRFLRLYRSCDFLSAVAMSGVADLARLRALWLLARTYPQPVGDKLPLARLKSILAFGSDVHAREFLVFHGLQVVEDSSGAATVILPKKNSPEAAQCGLLTGPAKRPEKCEFPKGSDSMLAAKYKALGLSRADIVFGKADPVVAEASPSASAVPQLAEAAAPAAEALAPAAAPAEDQRIDGS